MEYTYLKHLILQLEHWELQKRKLNVEYVQFSKADKYYQENIDRLKKEVEIILKGE